MKLERSIEQYRNGKPEVIVEGSKAQILFALQDARKDVLTLAAENDRLNGQLKLMSMTAVGAEREADEAYKELNRLRALEQELIDFSKAYDDGLETYAASMLRDALRVSEGRTS